jgi:YVTN family beta-propeller protein
MLRIRYLVCLTAVIFSLLPPASAQLITATVTTGTNPIAVGVNPVTNKIYVANNGSNNVSVIDGATSATATVAAGTHPVAVGVNPVTNKIYVANEGSNNVTVIDGATNSTTTVAIDSTPVAVAVNPVTNKIYVAESGGCCGLVVIDGATNNTTSIALAPTCTAIFTSDIAVNPVTNKTYVLANDCSSGHVFVVDGSTNNVTPVNLFTPNLFSLAVNPVTNKVYVTILRNTGQQIEHDVVAVDGTTNGLSTVVLGTSTLSASALVAVNPVTNKIYAVINGNDLTVIDGATNSTTTVAAGTNPSAVAVDPETNQVYVANTSSANVTVIDGNTNNTTTVATGTGPFAVAVNPVTNKAYVANSGSQNATVIDGATDETTTVAAGTVPFAGAVNPATNQIYVANEMSNNVTVIDGATNNTTTVAVGTSPRQVAANPVTNQIYVANGMSNNVTVIDGATNNTTTVAAGTNPVAVALNAVTNQIYIANNGSGNMTVIDGMTNNPSTVTVGANPVAVAVNPASDEIYVVNNGDNSVTVVDGVFGSTTTLASGASPVAVAVNPVTNQIYVANNGSGNLTVIDGATNLTTTLAVGANPVAVAVNPASNKIFVVNNGDNTVTVIDGATNNTNTVAVGMNPVTVAVNPVTDQIYVANSSSDTVTVIDGATLATTTLSSGATPAAVTVNPVTNQIYVANKNSNNVTVIEEQQVQAIPLTTTIAPIANGVTSDPLQPFTFSASSTFSPNAPPVRNVFFQVDTWQGPWIAATANGATFTGTPSASLPHGTHIVYAFATDGEDATSTGLGQRLIGNIAAEVFTVDRDPSNTTIASDNNPAVLGQTVTFTVTVSASGGRRPLGRVTILDNGNLIGASVLRGGQIRLITSTLAVGSHTITAIYHGDKNFAGSTGSLTGNPQVINQANTNTVVTSSLNPAVFGQSVTFTATISPAPPGSVTPSGMVTFLDGVNSIGTGMLNNGVATLTTSSLTAGSHTITASYGGDGNFNGSTGPLTGNPQVVSQANTTTAVASSVNPSVAGQPVTFTATVSTVAPGAGTPTGMVTFFDGGNSIGTGTLGGSMATFQTSALTAGPHSITAQYSGDSNFVSSTSAGLSQMVNTRHTTSVLTFSINPVAVNQQTTVTLTVTDDDPKGTASTPSGTITLGSNVPSDSFSPATCMLAGSGATASCPVNLTASTTTPAAHVITGTFAADGVHSGSNSSPILTVIKANQTITFGALANKTFGDPDFTASASATSGLTVSFSASGNCSVTGSTVHITGAGPCKITASQAGNSNFNAAADVPQAFSIAKANQTITFGTLANKIFGGPDFTVSASATSGLTISFGAGGNCSVTGSTVHITGAGTCTITASQGGNSNFNAAADVPQTFSIAKADQTIMFGMLANKTFGGPDFTVGASATSGLAVNFSAAGNCSVTGSTVHLTSAGTCTITASQGGNSNFNAAADVPQPFSVVTPGALYFVPVTPCRIADTRNPNGPFGGPFLGGQTSRGFAIPNSACNIPATAQAYSLNATVVPHGPLGFLTTFPCGQTQPLVSTLNSIDGRVKAVAAIVPAGTNGAVCAFVTNDTDLVLDIDGYFVPATDTSALAFYPVTPCRLIDTRSAAGPLGGPSLMANTARTFPLLTSSCNLPTTAKAYGLNFTSVPKGSLGFLTTWPAGQTQPLVSTLNAPTGAVTANAAIVPADANGDISVFVTNDSDLVVDVNGYFAPPGPGGLSLFNLSPCRVLDTRNPAGAPPFNGTRNVNIAGSGCGAPASAQAYVLNATVVPPGTLGFLTLWPQGATQPLVSTLNAGDGFVTSNLGIVPATSGSISAFATNPTHLVLDISGYFASPTTLPSGPVAENIDTPAQKGPAPASKSSDIPVSAPGKSDTQPANSTVFAVVTTPAARSIRSNSLVIGSNAIPRIIESGIIAGAKAVVDSVRQTSE